jgi:hypothetical protein
MRAELGRDLLVIVAEDGRSGEVASCGTGNFPGSGSAAGGLKEDVDERGGAVLMGEACA